jgi:hypothetical protein
MQLKIFTMSRSAAETVETKSAPKAPAGIATGPEDESRARRIRRVREFVGDLLLEDEANDLLVGVVSEGLNRIMLELEDLAGRQELYELWCQ